MPVEARSAIRWAAVIAGGVLLTLAFFWQSAERPPLDASSDPNAQIAELQRAIAEGPYDESHRYRLGHLMLQHSPPDETIAYFAASVATDPKPQTSHYIWGTALSQKKLFREAFDHYRIAIEIDPAHEMTENQWGTVLARQGKREQAVVHFKRAVEIHPEFQLAHANLARILHRLGHEKQAQHHDKLAQTSNSKTSKRYFYWGRALLQADRPEAAAVELKKALQIDPEDDEARRLLDEALRATEEESLEGLRALGYIKWDADTDPELSGVRVFEPSRASPGFNLYTNDVDEAYLMDLEGNRVHRWRLEGKRGCQYARLLEDGKLIVVCVEESLALLDWNSNVIWEVPLRVDHDVTRREDGSYLVAHLPRARNYQGRRVVFDQIARISETGEVLDPNWWSAYRALETLKPLYGGSPLDKSAVVENSERVFDYYHLNTIEVLPDTPLGQSDPRFRAGNYLLCLRNVNLIAILDQDDLHVTWSWGTDVLDQPHMPTMLNDGNILIFDNGPGRGFSRILELDPLADEIIWRYRAQPPTNFFSDLRGSSQRLPNGNTLICESERGHVFEVTESGEIVWEFWNPELIEGKRKRIYRFLRLPPAYVEPILQANSSRG